MLGRIREFLLPPKKVIATFELSAVLWSVLPYGARHRLHFGYPLSRATRPLLDEVQIAEIVRITAAWGDQFVTFRQVWQTHLEDQLHCGTDAMVRVPDSYVQHIKGIIADCLQPWQDLEPEQYYELWDRAHSWVRWRVRRASNLNYGNCEQVVANAHWSFLNYLLTLEKPE
jgi:hypothetical protein